MNALTQHIQQYVSLTPEEATFIAANTKGRRYQKGQFICQSGDVCRHHTFIVKGTVKTFYLDKEGNEHIVAFAIDNWWAGDMGSFIEQTPADFDVQCLENTEVIQITPEMQSILFDQVPSMERFFRILVQKAYVSAQRRIVRNLSLSAKQRYLLFMEEYPEFLQRIPQYMIASYLGITKEFLSQLKNQLAKSARS